MTHPNEQDFEIDIVDGREEAFILVGGMDGKLKLSMNIPPLQMMDALLTICRQIGIDHNISTEEFENYVKRQEALHHGHDHE